MDGWIKEQYYLIYIPVVLFFASLEIPLSFKKKKVLMLCGPRQWGKWWLIEMIRIYKAFVRLRYKLTVTRPIWWPDESWWLCKGNLKNGVSCQWPSHNRTHPTHTRCTYMNIIYSGWIFWDYKQPEHWIYPSCSKPCLRWPFSRA